jgi:hypothetical protein
LPQTGESLLLNFGPVSDQCPRLRTQRIGYSFCPTCISEQSHVHVRLEWVFAALLRCYLHKIPLRHGCPECDEDDPLPFVLAPAYDRVLCWKCGENPTRAISASHYPQIDAAHTLAEKLYRATLRGALPGDVTGAQFRRFVDYRAPRRREGGFVN